MADTDRKDKLSILSHIAISIASVIILFVAVILQCADIRIMGRIPDFTFALVCAIGFVARERYGAIFGLLGGVLVMALGGSGISLAPVCFTLCAYLSGVLPNIILRRNFLSYLIFCAMLGGIHTFFSLVYYVMISESSEIWNVIGRMMIPDFITTVICMIPAYFAVLGIYTLFKGKTQGKGRGRISLS